MPPAAVTAASPAVADVAANNAETAKAAADSKATASVFPKVETRWRKWELRLIDEYAQKNNWQALPPDSVRVIPYSAAANGVETAFEVNLNTGEVAALGGKADAPNIRPFKLQGTELEDLRRALESKQFHNLSEEKQMAGEGDRSLLVETNWQGQYLWRLYWGDIPPELKEIEALIRKAYDRPH